ncbi:MAG: glycosyltransferase family 2 protein [Planctomycetes bacterium]|nr:glycosyltransferase family 2 protein [Planctomycetota bacterium]
MPPLFSVVVPSYNRAGLIGATLRSVLAQRMTDWEIIVADDGSTDGTPDIAAAMDPRVRVVRQPNKGPGAARNLGVAHATGKYVALLDSDDLWFPWTLEVFARIIREAGEPSLISGKMAVFTDERSVADVRQAEPRWLRSDDFYASHPRIVLVGSGMVVIRRDAYLAAGGFVEGHINYEDLDFGMRLGVSPGFVEVLDPPTVAVRQHAGSVTKIVGRTLEGALYLIDQENAGKYPGGAAREHERRVILSRLVRPASFSGLTANADERRMAWEIYRRTFRWSLHLRRWRYLAGFPVRGMLGR